jgi:hypothetical protein
VSSRYGPVISRFPFRSSVTNPYAEPVRAQSNAASAQIPEE